MPKHVKKQRTKKSSLAELFVQKSARNARPDRYEEFNEAMRRAYQHPETTFGAIQLPVRSFLEGFDEPSKFDDKKQAVKAGFLLRCAEEGLSLDQLENRIDQLLAKQAGIGEAAGQLVGAGTKLLTNLAGKMIDLGGTVALGAPVLAGGLGGLALSRATRPDTNKLKAEALSNEYATLTDQAKRRSVLRRLQEEDPGSVVRLN